jgi:hypothetical protein
MLQPIATKWHLPMAIAKVTIETPGSVLKTRSRWADKATRGRLDKSPLVTHGGGGEARLGI